MSIDSELKIFYSKHGFGEDFGFRPKTISVYTGCMLVPLPNIETRRTYLKYHDIHHLVTGYTVGRIGEGKISAWELGTGSAFINPMLGVMNLIALSTGLFLEPKDMWNAFKRGCISTNLYSKKMRNSVDNQKWSNIKQLQESVLEFKQDSVSIFRAIEFALYSLFAVLIHAILVVPAIILRFVTDTIFNGGIFEAVKPKKRDDLF
ncbi:MAG: hypothetical protein AAF304_02835 [Pseudomonadota bacterium]